MLSASFIQAMAEVAGWSLNPWSGWSWDEGKGGGKGGKGKDWNAGDPSLDHCCRIDVQVHR
jgi:hypothetical protein